MSTGSAAGGNRRNLMSPEPKDPIQMGFWTPNRIYGTAKYLIPLRQEVAAREKAGTLAPMTPAIVDFKDWVTSNSVYRMWVNSMIEQANAYVWETLLSLDLKDLIEIVKDGDAAWIPSYDMLFVYLNEIITTSPGYNDTVMVGTPMNGLLAVSMATDAGLALFHDATFNREFKKVLDAWNGFLRSKDSLDKLDIEDPEKPGSWISTAATNAGVWTDMVHNKSLPAYGYNSWNSFFIRQFVPNARPFHGDANKVVNIGCETTPWKYEDDLPLEAKFWIKDVNYSLLDLFGGENEWAELFVGGQLYQGFLSATHYHRWRAPLTGEIVRSWVQPGTYFAQRPGQGEDEGTWEGTESQPYLGHVATRAIFVFNHPAFGYVAMICIGMVEVSTCVIERDLLVAEGASPISITRNTEIGHFEFGGSTHVMIFQKGRAKLEEWAVDSGENPQNDPPPVAMGSIIATLP